MFEILVGTRYKFMERRRYAYALSVFLVLVGLASLIIQGGPKESIDFTGGSVLFVDFGNPVAVADVRQAAAAAGLDGAEVQMAEEETQAIIRFRYVQGDTLAPFESFEREITPSLAGGGVTLLSQEEVGPKIGKELERKAILAIFWSLLLLLGYIAWRFTRISFGLSAVIALFFTIFATFGVMSILRIEIDLTVVAAFLTLGGYAINDTIVVFDRIRENTGLSRRMSFQDIINRSVNQTLSRTILTGGTTIMTLTTLFFLGGTVIHSFAMTLLIGILIGTYSSVFVASALALDINNWWLRRRAARGAKPGGPKDSNSRGKTAETKKGESPTTAVAG